MLSGHRGLFVLLVHEPPLEPNVAPMKKHPGKVREEPPMRAEYDFRGGTRGKYAQASEELTIAVVLDQDVAAAFPTARAVNTALRRVMRESARPAVRKRPPR